MVYTVYHLFIFCSKCILFLLQLGYSQASNNSTSGFNSRAWCNATLNSEYRHFVKAPEGKKRAKIRFTIQALNRQHKIALLHTSQYVQSLKLQKAITFMRTKETQFISTLQWLHGNTLICTYKNVSENRIISRY